MCSNISLKQNVVPCLYPYLLISVEISVLLQIENTREADIHRFSDKLVISRTLYWKNMNALDVKSILFTESFQVLIIHFGGDTFSTVAYY